jgi:transketolase
MRATFSRLLAQAAQADVRVLVLTGDHGYALFDEFRQICPDRFINCGVAEQNMVGVAAGLAKAGLCPIVYGLAAFVPLRVLEQIKLDICYESLPAILVGDGAGLVYGTLGASHQCAEDVAALRALANLDIYSPADRFELEYCFAWMRVSGRPSYLRFGKADLGDVHAGIPTAAIGDLLPVRPGRDRSPYLFVATGSMVLPAARLADELAQSGDGPAVWSAPSLHPINRRQLIDLCRPCTRAIVFEEHSVNGGLGSLVAEVLSESGVARVTRIGIEDRFSQFCGSYQYLLDYHGIGAAGLRARVAAVMAADAGQ